MKTYLNLGCGDTFHDSWSNFDFVSSHAAVKPCNLLNGIPVTDNSADVVYHSHVLEHFSAENGKSFIQECFRVLKPGGIIRIAVPDLENIVKEYLKNLEGARNGDSKAADRYEWIKLELIDQMVRHSGGGQCGQYFFRENMPAEEYVYERWGETARVIRNAYKKAHNASFSSKVKWKLKQIFRSGEDEATRVGKFRLSGEVHLWMYDSFSLGNLLRECGFGEIQVLDPFKSNINNWNEFALEVREGKIMKPDSLVMEAKKPL
ncbi:MAG: methyltransferase domain-containing protein [Bacteroidia bacterium]|nr:methyltransferase domain-containing protein [Bacteroidia bacterium]